MQLRLAQIVSQYKILYCDSGLGTLGAGWARRARRRGAGARRRALGVLVLGAQARRRRARGRRAAAGACRGRGAGASSRGAAGARPGRWAPGLGARAGYGLCTRCTRPVFDPVRLGIVPESIFGHYS